MKNFYVLLVSILTLSLGWAQSTIDFEPSGAGSAWAWTTAANGSNPPLAFIANPDMTTNTTATVAEFQALAAGDPWALCFSDDIGSFTFSSSNSLVKIMVHKPTISDVGVKFESTTGAPAIEIKVPNTVTNAWEELSFDFSGVEGNEYSRVVIIPDFIAAGPRPADITLYFDEITFNANSGSGLAQMDLPVTFEEATVEYGLAGFGGTDSSIVPNPDTNVNTSATVAKVIKTATAATWAGTTVTAGTNLGFANAIPFTATDTKMNVMVWSPDAGIPVLLKVEDHADATHSVETLANTTVANQWEVLEFDFSNQATGTAVLDLSYTYDKASIFFNFGVDGATAGEKTYYFDDMKFGPNTLATEDIDQNGQEITFYPNPAKSGSTLTFSENVKEVEFYNSNGIKAKYAQGNQVQLDVQPGVYFLRVVDKDGGIHNEKLMVR